LAKPEFTLRLLKRKLQDLNNDVVEFDETINDVIVLVMETRAMFIKESMTSSPSQLQSDVIKLRDRQIMFELNWDRIEKMKRSFESLMRKIEHPGSLMMKNRLEIAILLWKTMKMMTSQRQYVINKILGETEKFNENYRRLSDWLNRKEAEIALIHEHNCDVIMSKMRDDFAIGNDHRAILRDLGEDLKSELRGSDEDEVEMKMRRIDERWSYLEELLRARSKKVKGTLKAVNQLNLCMMELRDWLKAIEDNLNEPIRFEKCSDEDIKQKLKQQQIIQEEISCHSNGVSSVINLCEVLLHDADACPEERDREEIRDASSSLSRRWKSICVSSEEKTKKIEETKLQWEIFFKDHLIFSNWLKEAEKKAEDSNIQLISYKNAKNQLKSYETLQHQIHNELNQLEAINKQYRKLTRENRTDSSEELKNKVHDANMRWDLVMKKVFNVIRRLKHVIQRREEFESKREELMVWLTEKDLLLTHMEHLSPKKITISKKYNDLLNFKEKINEKLDDFRILGSDAKSLQQSSESSDIDEIEAEMKEIYEYCCDVTKRLSRYNEKLQRLSDHSLRPHLNLDLEDFENRSFDWWKNGRKMTSSLPQVDRRTTSSGVSLEWDPYPNKQEIKLFNIDNVTNNDVIASRLHGDFSEGRTSQLKMFDDEMASKRSSPISISQLHSGELGITSSASTTSSVNQQLQHDVTAVMSWLRGACRKIERNNDVINNRNVTVNDLEQIVCDLKELQREIESRRSLHTSINLMKSSADHNINVLNNKWNDVREMMTSQRESCRRSLLESIDFSDKMLEIEKFLKCQKIKNFLDLPHLQSADLKMMTRPKVQKAKKSFKEFRSETLGYLFQISRMQDISNEIVLNSEIRHLHPPDGAVDICNNLSDISEGLRSLLDSLNRQLDVFQRHLHQTARQRKSSSEDSSVDTSLHATSSPLKLKMLRHKMDDQVDDDLVAMEVSQSFDENETKTTNYVTDDVITSKKAFWKRSCLAASLFYLFFILVSIVCSIQPRDPLITCLKTNNLYWSVYPTLQWYHGPPPI